MTLTMSLSKCKMEKEYKLIKENVEQGLQFVGSMGGYAILIKNERVADSDKKIFKNIRFEEVFVGDNSFLHISGKKEVLETIYISMEQMGVDLSNALSLMREATEFTTENLLKWRGDIAECLFIVKNGGEKVFDGATVDIKLEDEFIEIKSFSKRQRTVQISYSQIMEDSRKFAVEVSLTNNGKTIMELSEMMVGNLWFKNYIKEEYGNSVFGGYKVEFSDAIEFTDELVKFDLPNCYTEAKMKFKIK